MGWKGIAFGALAGGLFGKGYIGAVFGALLGHRIEEYLRRRAGKRRSAGAFVYDNSPLADAYAELGVKSSASDSEVKRAYRSLAKKFHPDAVRSQGLSEEAATKADERMKRINRAWGVIKDARGL
ncbi:MAG: J domain-containing protein [Kiritimatiellae bacterium]|jgi:DnaJ like chaperone protein|nr:J domain-containing protein [Kiritimatiellia bacterium]